MSRDRLLASAFFLITNNQAEQISSSQKCREILCTASATAAYVNNTLPLALAVHEISRHFCNWPHMISLAVVDFTHFKRKRSLKIDRATCPESAISNYLLPQNGYNFLIGFFHSETNLKVRPSWEFLAPVLYMTATV